MQEGALEQNLAVESLEQKQARFAQGNLTPEEIREYWKKPDQPLFQTEVIRNREGVERKTEFRVRALTAENKDALLESVRGVWAEEDLASLSNTLDLFFEQRSLENPALLNAEYYVATDTNDQPFAIVGIYTIDIYGAGFATKDRLAADKHFLATRLGWFSVSKEHQGDGVGGFLLDWVEKLSKARGGQMMVIETDDYENERMALKLYQNRGYRQGLDIPDYFGPGRNLVNYFARVELPEEGSEQEAPKEFISKEKVSEENKEELLELGKRIYSPERFEEFKVCLDLFLNQSAGAEAITVSHSFVLRNSEGKLESFSILITQVYDNAIFSSWEGSDPDIAGSKPRLAQALQDYAVSQGIGIVMVSREGEDVELLDNGFAPANDGVPEVFAYGDSTNFLVYSKKL